MRLVFFVIVSLVLATPAGAQEAASLETFLAMSPQELETVQVALNYLGPTSESMPPLLITVHGHAVDKQLSQLGFTVSVEELQGLIRNVQSALSSKHAPPEDPWVSVVMTGSQAGMAKSFKAELDRFQAKDFFVLMRGSLHADPRDITLMEGQANLEAMRELQSWGCALGLLPEGTAAKDVTNQVHVTMSGLRWNPQTKHFESTVTLMNTLSKPIKGPVALVVHATEANVINAHGSTCVTSPVGQPFINVPMPSLTLEPGKSLEMVVEFRHEQGVDISFTTKVLAGVGER